MNVARQTFNLCVFLLMLVSLARAGEDGQAAVETKLRESLRGAMLQLRTVEGEKAVLQAAKAEAEAKAAATTADLDKLAKQSAVDKIAAEKALSEVRGKLAAAEDEAARLRESLGKWQAGYSQLAEAAKAKENERARLAHEAACLERKVADQRARNTEMFRLAAEVLSRYEKFGLGEALSAREPFTGLTRARLENLVQDYTEKLEKQRIRPDPVPSNPAGGVKKP